MESRRGRDFISVSGEVGTGKTTIIHHLLAHLDRAVKIVFISQTKVTFEELLKDVLWELKLPAAGRDKSSLIRQFNRYLMARLGRKQNLALLIDEAQHLSIDALEDLRLLSNLETSTSKLLQIVLVGQPELEEKAEFQGTSAAQTKDCHPAAHITPAGRRFQEIHKTSPKNGGKYHVASLHPGCRFHHLPL